MPYYAYSSLKEEQKKMVRERGWTKGSQKVNRFLFRLVNRVQPDTIIEVGRPSSTALYYSLLNHRLPISLLPTCRNCFWMRILQSIFCI